MTDEDRAGALLVSRSIEEARRLGVEARPIAPEQVVVAEWVRLKCRYGCSGYGADLLCPPHTPTPTDIRRVLDDYRRCLLLRLDVTAGAEAGEQSRRLTEAALRLERSLFLSGAHKALAFTAGGFCRQCESCPSGVGCRYPERARPPMTACGIDVFSTAANAGWSIDVVADRDGPYHLFALVLVD